MKDSKGNHDIQLSLDGIVGEPSFNLPEAKLRLAKLILFFLFSLVIIICILNLVPDEYITARAVKFTDNLYQGIVPVVSVVIGYYFAKD